MHASKWFYAVTFGITMMISSTVFALPNVVYSNSDLGSQSDTPVLIGLTGLAHHSQVEVNFNLYILDYWNASDAYWIGPDNFGFSLNDNSQNWSFSNFGGPVNDEVTPPILGDKTGYWTKIDRYFANYNNGFVFNDTNSNVDLTFFGNGIYGNSDAAWRVTDLVVTTTGAPLPVAAPFLMVGAGLLGIIRKRKN